MKHEKSGARFRITTKRRSYGAVGGYGGIYGSGAWYGDRDSGDRDDLTMTDNLGEQFDGGDGGGDGGGGDGGG